MSPCTPRLDKSALHPIQNNVGHLGNFPTTSICIDNDILGLAIASPCKPGNCRHFGLRAGFGNEWAQCCDLLAIGLLGLDHCLFRKLAWFLKVVLSGQFCSVRMPWFSTIWWPVHWCIYAFFHGQINVAVGQVEHPTPLSDHANRWEWFVESGQKPFWMWPRSKPLHGPWSLASILANPLGLNYGVQEMSDGWEHRQTLIGQAGKFLVLYFTTLFSSNKRCRCWHLQAFGKKNWRYCCKHGHTCNPLAWMALTVCHRSL